MISIRKYLCWNKQNKLNFFFFFFTISDIDNEDWYILKLVFVVDPHQNIIQENP